MVSTAGDGVHGAKMMGDDEGYEEDDMDEGDKKNGDEMKMLKVMMIGRETGKSMGGKMKTKFFDSDERYENDDNDEKKYNDENNNDLKEAEYMMMVRPRADATMTKVTVIVMIMIREPVSITNMMKKRYGR